MLRDMTDERVASELAAAGWKLRAISTDNGSEFRGSEGADAPCGSIGDAPRTLGRWGSPNAWQRTKTEARLASEPC